MSTLTNASASLLPEGDCSVKTNRTVVVTGGASGIGFEIAAQFSKEGYRVALLDHDVLALENALKELNVDGVRCMAAVADVTKKEAVTAAFKAIREQVGKIDVLINNAGISRDSRLINMTEENWDLVVDVNLKSQFLCCKEAVPDMLEAQSGRIINISSRAWLGGFGQANYSASKGGVVSLTRSLAIELAKDGITVNAIAPGIIDTPLLQSYTEETRERLAKTVPARRVGSPGDVAQAALFFADEKASYITGQTLYVCGGRSLSSPSV